MALLGEKLALQAAPKGKWDEKLAGPDVPRKPHETLGKRQHHLAENGPETGLRGPNPMLPK